MAPPVATATEEHAACLAGGGDEAWPVRTVSRGPRRSAALAWASGLLGALLLGAGTALLAARGLPAVAPPGMAAAPPLLASPSSAVSEQAVFDCKSFFGIGKDCSKKNRWECIDDDGSLGYNCCCKHGWGDFSFKHDRGIGVITWAAHPDKCVDLSMPYVGSGVDFDKGFGMISACDWGNPNKHFHIPLKGRGKLHWATHTSLCLGVQNGGMGPGNGIGVQACPGVDPNWQIWDVGTTKFNVPHMIKVGANPSLCIEVAGGSTNDGTRLQLANCQNTSGQLWNVSLPPQPPPYADSPGLFCISLMIPRTYEFDMLKDQHAKKVGIFQCNDYAVYSNESLSLSKGKHPLKTDVLHGSLIVKFGGEWHSALNTDIFIRFWGKVIEDHRTWRNEWTVKIDPDAVFFPSRLREMLRNRWYAGKPPKPSYLNNCHRGMHGPIEVLSKKAMEVYKKHWRDCKEGEPYEHKQEDFYFRRCWKLLKIQKVEAYNLLFENLYACDERSDTRDGRHPCFSRQVSFHPFKSVEAYNQCHRRGASQHWVAPMNIIDQVPSKTNFHHA